MDNQIAGTFYRRVDAGRLSLPVEWEPMFADSVVIAPWFDCLTLWPRDGWENFVAALTRFSENSTVSKTVLRRVVAGAYEEYPDRRGRVTLPLHLQKRLLRERDTVLIGVQDHAEIWLASIETRTSTVVEKLRALTEPTSKPK